MSTEQQLQHWQLGRMAKLQGLQLSSCPELPTMLRYYWLEGFNNSRAFIHNYYEQTTASNTD